MTKLKKLTPGILFCFGTAVPAWFLGQAFPLIGSPVFGMIFGILITLIAPELLIKRYGCGTGEPDSGFRLEEGVKYTSKKLLQYSVILLGFGMNLFHVLKVGGQSLFVILFTLGASFIVAYFLGKGLKIDGNVATLVGVGTSICGGSAIAATAPVIKAKDEDVAHAISTIFLFNIIAVLIFPAMGRGLGLSDMGFGMWAGTAINDTSSVVAAGTAWSNAAGNNTALAFATIVKLTRTLMILPITLFLAFYTARKIRKEQDTEGSVDFSIVKIFPWFVIGFLFTAVINTFFLNSVLSEAFVVMGKFLIVMAMSAIGLNTNLKKLISNGIKPILLGFCCWVSVAFVSLVVQSVMQLW